MFTILEKRVARTLFVAVAAFLAVLSLLIGAVVGTGAVAAFEGDVAEAMRIAVDYSAIKLDTIRSDARRIADDDVVVAGLAGSAYAIAINPKLNYFRSQYQGEVAGLTLYAENGTVYKTDSLPVASVIPYPVLAASPSVAAFLAGDEADAVLILCRDDPDAVRSVAILVKVEAAGERLGLLFIDVSPDSLFAEYFAFAGHAGFSPLSTYVYADGKVRHPSVNRIDAEHLELAADGRRFSRFGSVYAASTPLYAADARLMLSVDSSPLVESLAALIALLLAIDAVLLLFTRVAARRHARRLASRLEALRLKMSRPAALE